MPGRDGWVAFAFPLPTGVLSSVLSAYDHWNSSLQTLVLGFVVEVQDNARMGTLKDARVVSKMIMREDIHILCSQLPPPTTLADRGYSQSTVLGLMPRHALSYDNVGLFPPLQPVLVSSIGSSVLGVTTLLMLGLEDEFRKSVREHDSIDVQSIFCLYFTSNIKHMKVVRMIESGDVFRVPPGQAFELDGDVIPTEKLLRVCPSSSSLVGPSRGCVSHYLAQQRVLDFTSNSIYKMQSLFMQQDPDTSARTLLAWARAAQVGPASEDTLLVNHTHSVGREYEVNSRYRQGYLLTPAMPVPVGAVGRVNRQVAQHTILAASACLHTANTRAPLDGAYMVVVPRSLPVQVQDFVDSPYWGRLFALAFRDLLGLREGEVYVNETSATWYPTQNATRFNIHIVLPFVTPQESQRLTAVLNYATSPFMDRLRGMVAANFKRYFNTSKPSWRTVHDFSARFEPTPLTSPTQKRSTCAARVTPHTYSDVNNADNAALEVADGNGTAYVGRMVQLTGELPIEEFCGASEKELLKLLKDRFSPAFAAASEGTVQNIQPTALVTLSDEEEICGSARTRRLLQRDIIQVIIEVVLIPKNPDSPMIIRTTTELSNLGVRRIFIEPTRIVNITTLSAGADWVKEGEYYVPPLPTSPENIFNDTLYRNNIINNSGLKPETTSTLSIQQELFLFLNVICMVLLALHLAALVLLFGHDNYQRQEINSNYQTQFVEYEQIQSSCHSQTPSNFYVDNHL